jgi:hypothetical protein
MINFLPLKKEDGPFVKGVFFLHSPLGQVSSNSLELELACKLKGGCGEIFSW